MKNSISTLFLFLFLILVIFFSGCNQKSSTTAEKVTNSPSTRKEALKEWKDMKFGMFIHWGIYSVPAGIWKGKQIEKLGEQIQRHAKISHDEYEEIASKFNPVKFDADAVVQLAKNAGMKYIVFTAKHHDGFCMFDSKYTNWDIIDASPYGKDILKQLANACKKHGLKLGIYYSTPDWHFNYPNVEINPNDNKLSVFGKVSKANEDYEVNQLQELLSNYGDIVELFFDMGEPTLAQSKRFAQTVHALQPKCVINGRVMNNQGDFITMPDNHVPEVPIDTLAWETPGTFYHTWGYKSWVKRAPVEMQVKTQIRKLSQIAARGGNFLLNIGPKPDGTVLPYEVKVLNEIGEWMKTNHEAIYATGTTPFRKLDWGECTTGKNKLYLYIFDWPKNNKLKIPGLRNKIVKAYPLAHSEKKIDFFSENGDKLLDLSPVSPDKNVTIIVVEYSGDLNIEHDAAKANSKGEIILDNKLVINHGKYGRESYRSILKDYYRSWDVIIDQPGDYEVSLAYKLKYDSKDFVLEANKQKLNFTLTGEGQKSEKAEIIDGNENSTKIKQQNGSEFKNTVVGKIHFNKTGRQTICLKQGKEFKFMTTTNDFKNQDHKYRGMNIDVKMIELKPVN
ncbi:MAG: alpha-L-fucosidase [Prolixibacteraceae bacterium]|nr:alpha-L-fucosidase [Prolixibacteraceae bacterium]